MWVVVLADMWETDVIGPYKSEAAAQEFIDSLPDDWVEKAEAILQRHVTGDWGQIHPGDRGINEQALRSRSRMLSVYKDVIDQPVWVITDAGFSATTILLPEEY